MKLLSCNFYSQFRSFLVEISNNKNLPEKWNSRGKKGHHFYSYLVLIFILHKF